MHNLQARHKILPPVRTFSSHNTDRQIFLTRNDGRVQQNQAQYRQEKNKKKKPAHPRAKNGSCRRISGIDSGRKRKIENLIVSPEKVVK